MKTLEEVLRRFPEAVPLLDPESDMRIKDDGFRKLQRFDPPHPPALSPLCWIHGNGVDINCSCFFHVGSKTPVREGERVGGREGAAVRAG